MPWKPEDADRHKKGLTNDEKKRWASTANAVRKRCLDDGGSERTCDARAIRIANSSAAKHDSPEMVMRLYEETVPRQLSMIASGEIRDIKHDEATGVLTAEVIISREAVLPYEAPSGGFVHEYIPAEELRRDEFLASAHGKPITVGHPTEQVVTMDTLSQYSKGALHGPFRAAEIDGVVSVIGRETIWDPALVKEILAGRKRQVSVGRWAVLKDESGTFNGVSYTVRQTGLILNHLAHTDTGRQGDACRILLDTAGWDAVDRDIKDLYNLPAEGIVEGFKEMVVRYQRDVPALLQVVDGISMMKRQLAKAVLVAGHTENGAALQAALDGLNSEWPDLKADVADPVGDKVSGGDGIMEDVTVKAGEIAVTLPGKALSALDEQERKALADSIQGLAADHAKLQGELAVVRADLATRVAEAVSLSDANSGLADQFKALKAQFDAFPKIDSRLVALDVSAEVEERTCLLDAIRLTNPAYKQDGRSTSEMKRDLLSLYNEDMREAALLKDATGQYVKTDAYIQARVDLILDGLSNKTGSSIGASLLKPVGRVTSPIDEQRRKRLNLYKGGGETK